MFLDSDSYSDTNLESPTSVSWPDLRLYDVEGADRKERRGDKISTERFNREHREQLRLLRFFNSLKGFYTGNLDLTGRHSHRFETLSARWNAFLQDFNDISSSDSPKDVDKWKLFGKKWSIPSVATYEKLESLVRNLQRELEKLPATPTVQKLCLVHLPPVILDKVFEECEWSEDARQLSSTCKLLRNIGMSYIFTDYTLTLSFSETIIDTWTKGNKSDEEICILVWDELEARRQHLIGNLDFMLSMPAVTGTLTNLFINNKLVTYLRDLGVDYLSLEDFHVEIWDKVTDILQSSTNLKLLELTSIGLTEGVMRAIVSLPQLLTLRMTDCAIPEEVLTKIFFGGITPSRSIQNLDVADCCDASEGAAWEFVGVSSNLRALSMWIEYEEFLPSPSDLVIQRSNLFSTLRSILKGPQVTPRDILDLAQWIRISNSQAPLQLTHLKLTIEIWLADAPVFALLDALVSAPLQVLVLDGIKEGSFELFDRITSACPRLLGLTVNKRENSSQRRSRLVTWPHTSWEYATHFSLFQQLEHFSCNFRINTSMEISPSCLQYFEEGFLPEDQYRETFCGQDEWRYYNPDVMDDAHYLAYPFAVHCLTLKSFAVISDEYSCCCNIQHMPNGRIEFTPFYDPTELLERWDIYIAPTGSDC